MTQYNTDESIYNPYGNVATAKVEISEKTLSIIAMALSVAAFTLGIWSIMESQRAARETRVLQQLFMDHDALMIREGFKQPGDEQKGPAANLDYKPRSK